MLHTTEDAKKTPVGSFLSDPGEKVFSCIRQLV